MADSPHHNSQNGTGQNGIDQNIIDQQNGSGQNDIEQQNDTGQNGTHRNGASVTGRGHNGTVSQKCTCEFPRTYTDDDGNEIGKIKRILKTETLQMNDGARYSRPHVCDPNPNEWREVIPPVRPKTPPKHKSLCKQLPQTISSLLRKTISNL